MKHRPVVLCATAHELIEDQLGNIGTVLGLAVARLITTVHGTRERELLLILRRKAHALEDFKAGLTPCHQCRGCKGCQTDVQA